MHFSERDFPKELIKKNPHQNQIGIKLSMCQKQEHPFLHLRASCLDINAATILIKYMSTDKQCQGYLCLKLSRICKLEPKLPPGNHFVNRQTRTTDP